MTPRLVAVVTCWGRGRLEAACLAHHAMLFDDVVAVVSPEDPDPVTAYVDERTRARVRWRFAPNSPLGMKHNWGAMMALAFDATHLVVVGSDDVLSRRYVESLRRMAANGHEHVAPLDAYRLDRRTGRVVHEVGPRSDASERVYGSGRMVSADVMRRCGGWTPERERHLDTDLSDRIAASGGPRVHGVRMRDVGPVLFTTGDANMWPRWSAPSRAVDADEVAASVGVELARLLD